MSATAFEVLRSALVAEHQKRIALAPPAESKDLALTFVDEVRAFDDLTFHIEANRPHWQVEAIGQAIYALAGVDS